MAATERETQTWWRVSGDEIDLARGREEYRKDGYIHRPWMGWKVQSH